MDFKKIEYEGYENHKCNGCFYFRKYRWDKEPNCKICEFTEGAVYASKWDSFKKCK